MVSNYKKEVDVVLGESTTGGVAAGNSKEGGAASTCVVKQLRKPQNCCRDISDKERKYPSKDQSRHRLLFQGMGRVEEMEKHLC